MRQHEILKAKQLYHEGSYHEALEIANRFLDENPDDPEALFIMGGVFIQTQRKGLAHNLMARCLKFASDRPEPWINYGRTCADNEEGWKESEHCFKTALELNPKSRAAWENLAALEVQRCNPEQAVKYAQKALELNADSTVAKSTLGFAYLMLGQWDKGWPLYHAMVGHRSRPDVSYPDTELKEWDGSKGKTVIVHGEQGIGDELIYASFIPDMARDCKYVVYDGMERLNGLMRRSMPQNVLVSGQRWKEDLELPAHIRPDAYITQAGVGMFYRKTDDDYPGTPYLRADDDLRLCMRAMFDAMGPQPKIGIAWTGGTKNSRQHFRQRSLEELTPILRTPGVTWVSLQYNDPMDEIRDYKQRRGISINHYPWITEEKNYEYTAAMVAELDLVIAVPTSVTQLAGGLGKEAWVMVPKITGWLFSREKYVWAKSVRIFRDRPVKEIAGELERWLRQRHEAKAA